MSTARIKGQEVSFLLTRSGDLEDTLTDIKSFTMELEFEVKSQGYLGEKTNRKDYIFNGAKFDMELNLHKADYLKYQAAMIAKAKRDTPDVRFNITGVFAFPDGDTPTLTLEDVSFGPNTTNITSRGDYVTWKLQGEAEDLETVEA